MSNFGGMLVIWTLTKGRSVAVVKFHCVENHNSNCHSGWNVQLTCHAGWNVAWLVHGWT
jgi:hypothetical protein